MSSEMALAVMITRTGEAGEKLTQRLQQEGIKAWHIPTIKIISQELFLPMEDFQQVIFVSPNAVNHSVGNNVNNDRIKNEALRNILPKQLIAVGPGTEKCLRIAGFTSVVTPVDANSEGLLRLPQLQNVQGQHILIVKGRGGRAHLMDTLANRGAICHALEVYCRVSADIDASSWQDFLSVPKALKMVTIASVDALSTLTLALGGDLEAITLVVASRRIEAIALQRGYNTVLAASATNEAMLQAIMKLLDKSK